MKEKKAIFRLGSDAGVAVKKGVATVLAYT